MSFRQADANLEVAASAHLFGENSLNDEELRTVLLAVTWLEVVYHRVPGIGWTPIIFCIVTLM